MTQKKLFSIGEAAQICGVSIRTLRYYDSIGLLSPAHIEESSGYRYYAQKQIFIVALIQDLKSFDFSLSDIQEALKREDLSRITALFESKREEQEKALSKTRKNLSRIESRLRMLTEMRKADQELSASKSEEFQIKDLSERILVSVKEPMSFDNQTMVLKVTEVQKLLGNEAEGPYVMIFHESYENPHLTELEIGTLVSSAPLNAHQNPISQVRVLPAGLYAVTLHRGDHLSSIAGYQGLLRWIEKKQMISCGPPMKVYLRSLAFARTKDRLLIEIQIPVKVRRSL